MTARSSGIGGMPSGGEGRVQGQAPLILRVDGEAEAVGGVGGRQEEVAVVAGLRLGRHGGVTGVDGIGVGERAGTEALTAPGGHLCLLTDVL